MKTPGFNPGPAWMQSVLIAWLIASIPRVGAEERLEPQWIRFKFMGGAIGLEIESESKERESPLASLPDMP